MKGVKRMPKVKVVDIPVRYENVTHRKGESFEMHESQVIDYLVLIVEEPKAAKKVAKKNATKD